jgi:hypothetical protein
MPCQSKRKLARLDVPQQIDMFAGNAQATGDTPVWAGLPTETQAALTALLTRLILDHVANRRISSTEDGHDL